MRLFLLWVVVGSSAVFAQTWSTGSWSVCSATCGGGNQTRTVTCVAADGSPLPDASCTAPKPATTQTCNTQSCVTYAWSPSAWGTCSATCGGGTQTRTVVCMSSTGMVVADALCTDLRPTSSRSCNTQSCATYSWSAGAWGVCSATCGGGTQTRPVICVDGSGAQVADGLCSGLRPTNSQTCNAQACPVYTWTTGAWSMCSAQCGGGTQMRAVNCVDGSGLVVSATLCTGAAPLATQSCNTQSCPTGTWMTGAWGMCSVACGGGTQTRPVACVDAAGAVLPASGCAAAEPPSSQTCNSSACPTGTWMTGAWSMCSATCGGGTQSRTVTCVDGSGMQVASSACPAPTPPEMQTCNAMACPTGTWLAGAWSACDMSCGGGTQTRTVSCVDGSGASLPASACMGTGPTVSQACNTQACVTGAWDLGAWGACDVTCGGGLQSRTVRCVDGSGAVVADTACPQPRPSTEMTCNGQPCPVGTWATAAWGECSAACGGGLRERTVTCVDAAGAMLPASVCTTPRPATQEMCNTAACPSGTWQPGAWGECSAVCGGGTQSREVRCVDSAGAELPGSVCTGAAPAAAQACNETACPPKSCSVAPSGVLLLAVLALLRARR